jgi:hypothetical protein
VPEFIDPVFTKTSSKRSFSLNRKRAFWLVFAKTGSIISGTAVRWTALILKHSCTRSKGECTHKQKPQESTVHCTQCTAWINYLYRPQSIGLLLFKIVLRKCLASYLFPVNVSDVCCSKEDLQHRQSCDRLIHRLNMEVDLQSLFGLHVT